MPCRQICAAQSVVLLAFFLAGCDRHTAAAAKKAEPPATVPNVPKEDQLNTFTLTPEAETRLGIVTVAVEKRPTVRMRTYGGEVVLPTGASLVVTAPLAGFLKSPSTGGIPKTGAAVKKGQPIYELVPGLDGKSILSPAEKLNVAIARANLAQSQNDADAQVQQTDEQMKAAKIELDRADMLERTSSGTRRAADQARAAYVIAEKAYKAAVLRKDLWDKVQFDEEAGEFKPLVIEAPQSGIIRGEHAAANEGVAPGALLFEVMNLSTVWVKVPVYVGELREIAEDQPARLSDLEDRLGKAAIEARPVSAPPTALAVSSTADLYYETDNTDGRFRPGQKVNASLPLHEEREGLVIPWSAVVFDINGGTWVYQSLGKQKYTRRRVQVKYVVDSTAVLAGGPGAGVTIVTEGAAELFGTEFFTK